MCTLQVKCGGGFTVHKRLLNVWNLQYTKEDFIFETDKSDLLAYTSIFHKGDKSANNNGLGFRHGPDHVLMDFPPLAQSRKTDLQDVMHEKLVLIRSAI